MFGHQDDKKDKAEHEETVIAPDAPAPETDTAVPSSDVAVADSGTDDTAPGTAPTTDDAPGDDNAWQHPGAPIEDDKQAQGPTPIEDIIGGDNAGPDFKPLNASGSDAREDNTPHELIDIKQKALGDLAPLVGKLDQSPEDKFRTIMMMVQASDDQSLVKAAYEAAHKIKDDKVRAQALLDVVNEINYFTQHPGN